MFGKTLSRGLEKVSGALGFDTAALRKDLDALCKPYVKAGQYQLKLRAGNGTLAR